MRLTIADNIKPSIPKTDDTKEFMMKIKECSQTDITDKSIVTNLMSELTNKKFDWSLPIHDHVTTMTNLAARLASMGSDLGESLVVQFIMNSLPPEFGQFLVNYISLKEKWNIQEVKAMLILEEGRLNKSRNHSTHVLVHNEASSSKKKP